MGEVWENLIARVFENLEDLQLESVVEEIGNAGNVEILKNIIKDL